MYPRLPVFLLVISCIVVGNLAVLDYVYISRQSKTETPTLTTQQSQLSTPLPRPEPEGATCSASCMNAITNATASLTLAPTVPQKSTQTQTQKTSTPKEYFIPLGTGFTQSNEWVDVSGTDTTIDPANYGKIKRAVFEASMHIPVANGTIYARLFNVTDKHPVWFSEVSTSEGASTNAVSGNITLDSGNKLYRVQIKTSLQYPSYLDFSRIRISVE